MIAASTSLFPRDRLFARLDDVVAAPVALIVAPAAAGKSTAVREYLADRGIGHVRVDGAPDHAAPAAFLGALAAAFAYHAPTMGSTVAIAAQRFEQGDDDAVLAWAREHLADVTTTAFLDDLHHALRDPRAAEVLARLIDATQPRMRWILATRTADALPLARWMANGLLRLPIDSDDLVVTFDELRAGAAAAGVPRDDDALRTLHARLQGWPLGLAVALTRGVDDAGDASPERLYDLLVDAALDGRRGATADLLYLTALAGRFDDALLARFAPRGTGTAAVLESKLVRVLRDGVYAYDEPFRERLLRRIDAFAPERRERLFTRACDALEDAARWTESIALLIRRGDAEALAQALERRGFVAFESGQVAAVRDAFKVLPDELVMRRPMVLAMKAGLTSLDERLDVAEAWFRIAIGLASGDERREIVIRYALDLVRRERTDVIDVLEEEATGGDESSREDPALWALLATAYVLAHRGDDARIAIARALEHLDRVQTPAVRARVLHQSAYVALSQRDFAAAKDRARRAVEAAQESFLYDLAARALSVLYVLAVDVDDDAAESRRCLTRLEEAARLAGSPPLRVYAILNAYELEVLAGNRAAIERIDAELRELELFLTPLASETILPAQALRASWDGRFEHAYGLLAPSAEKQFDDDRKAQRWAEAAVYAAAAGLRAESAAAMRHSREALKRVDPDDRWALRTAAYLAIAEVLLGNEARARNAIASLRVLARCAGPRFGAMVHAIRALHTRWTTGWYGDVQLADALERLEANDLGGVARFIAALPLPAAKAPLTLSAVECEILRRAAYGATSRQIGAALGCNAQSIDAELRKICRKLSATGRRAAIARAIREGLIPERRLA
ncbi:MAG: hypothetical protein JOZ24_03155 [Candidatus Eremiobacteraeota bacterium]|nr:hypothetical protein [Candidatus Eremiobacteraeota bacterium]